MSWRNISSNKYKIPPSATLGNLHSNSTISIPNGVLTSNSFNSITRIGPFGSILTPDTYLPEGKYFQILQYPAGMQITIGANPPYIYPNDAIMFDNLVLDIFPIGGETNNPYNAIYRNPDLFPALNTYLSAFTYINPQLEYAQGDFINIAEYNPSYTINPISGNYYIRQRKAIVISYNNITGYLAFYFFIYTTAPTGPELTTFNYI